MRITHTKITHTHTHGSHCDSDAKKLVTLKPLKVMWTSARDDGVVEVYVSLTGSGLELVKPAVHNVFLRSLWGVMHTFIDGVRSVSDRDLSAWLFNTE